MQRRDSHLCRGDQPADTRVSEGGERESDLASAGRTANWTQLLLWEQTVASGSVSGMTPTGTKRQEGAGLFFLLKASHLPLVAPTGRV